MVLGAEKIVGLDVDVERGDVLTNGRLHLLDERGKNCLGGDNIGLATFGIGPTSDSVKEYCISKEQSRRKV